MKRNFPVIALALGLIVVMVLAGFHPLSESAERKLPLLTALLVVEFGFLVNLAAVIFGIRAYSAGGKSKSGLLFVLLNSLIAGYLLVAGINLWPGVVSG